LRFHESAFIGSPEFLDISLFAMVLVAASAATYIVEIRLRDAGDRDKNVLGAAREALAALVDTPQSPEAEGEGDGQLQ
jgi:hypothetical protein